MHPSHQDKSLTALQDAVQKNCEISNAIHARDYTLCVYLLRMREYFRWKRGIALGEHLSLDDVGDWVAKMESYWDEIEDLPYQTLIIGTTEFEPFDFKSVNQCLKQSGHTVVYSAGVGRRGQPHFVLANLLSEAEIDGTRLYISTEESARDIVAPPAMSLENSIFVRRDGVRRLLFELFEEWSFKKLSGAMSRLNERFDLENSELFESALDQVVSETLQVFVEHERGEIEAGKLLPVAWHEMLIEFSGTHNELYLRAVRDNVADSLRTWPMILNSGGSVCLDFWLAGVQGVRKQLLAQTDFQEVFAATSDNERLLRLQQVTSGQRERWLDMANRFYESFLRHGSVSRFEELAKAS